MSILFHIVKFIALALAVVLIVGAFVGILLLAGRLIPISDANRTGEVKTYDINQDVSQIQMDISVIRIAVKETSDPRIRIETNYKDLIVEEQGDRLTVKDKEVFYRKISEAAYMTLLIPKGKVFETVSIKTGVGRSEITDLRAKKIDFSLGTGKTTLSNVTANDRAYIEAGVGQIVVDNGAFNDLILNAGVGQVTFEGSITGRSTLSLGVGSSLINLKGALSDYTVKVKKGLGTITVNNEIVRDDTTLGDGDMELLLDGGVGTIHLNFSD